MRQGAIPRSTWRVPRTSVNAEGHIPLREPGGHVEFSKNLLVFFFFAGIPNLVQFLQFFSCKKKSTLHFTMPAVCIFLQPARGRLQHVAWGCVPLAAERGAGASQGSGGPTLPEGPSARFLGGSSTRPMLLRGPVARFLRQSMGQPMLSKGPARAARAKAGAGR